MKGYQRKICIQNNIKFILGKDCEVTNVMKFSKEIEMCEKTGTAVIVDEISMI